MTVNNKLKIAILTILSSQQLYAITFDPLQIKSAPGELLYAEMSFHQADANSKLDVSLATPEDLRMMGAMHQPPSQLTFFIRRNHQGEGAIVITSSRPMIDAELNIIVKIKEGDAAHLKHIRQPIRQQAMAASATKTSNEKSLTPKFIVSEKDIALNLPESTRFNVANPPDLKHEKLLNVPFALPPVLNISETKVSATVAHIATPPIEQTTTNQTASVATHVQDQKTTVTNNEADNIALSSENQTTGALTQINNTTVESESKNTEIETAEQNTQTQHQAKNTTPPAKKKTAENHSTPTNSKQHTVQRNESLWSIAQRISAETQQPLPQVMKQIKVQNEHAFIGGNASRLRQGSHLNFDLNSIPVRKNQNANQIAAKPLATPTEKAKYRLQQAEMSLVAESNQDSSTGSAKKDTLQQKTSADLSLKVMTAREKTVTLQRNVTQLELTLRQKDQRIQLLNARLAELQEQLKAQQETKKPTR
ncbi:FimV domain-containing protein [Acinetobacter sp. NIPH 2699]|uniref:FimV/HubP-related protein n=1 Tax=Acinetobacter sp. NIPH 2699 TaxID=2923433 RepID=UPI001F4B3234|nr:FimV domain-containing protein [Acinetobacter sp. NIPH 2699]MCH7335546.1 FimV domain-containing protein [Acinetobacter sp. NIPH 2699]